MKNLFIFLMLFISYVGLSQPTNNAPVPTRSADNVFSVYSDSYTNIATNYNPSWGQSGSVDPNVEPVAGSGNKVMLYANFNYQGTDLSTQNLSSMEYLHIDIWTSNATVVKVSPINSGTGAAEYLVDVPLVNGGWSSVDLPKSAFVGMNWDAVFQMKFDGQAGVSPSNIYLDNIYFWKNAVDPTIDATLSDMRVNGTTISGFSANTLSYNYGIPYGTSGVPQVSVTTTNSNATYTISQANAVPGVATVTVTSQNGSVSQTYSVQFFYEGPNTAAPTPPARNASDVISLFSNRYANIAIDAWSAFWDDSSISDTQIDGDDVKKISFTNFLGVDFSGTGNHINATQFTHFHMDIWTDNADLVGKVFNSKFSQWGGTSGEVSSFELPLNTGSTPALATSQWVSVDVPISSFTNSPQTRDDIAQFVITSNLGIVYVDNIYLYKGTPIANNEVSAGNTIKFYPNPVVSGENIYASENAKTIQIFDLNGKLIKSTKNTATIGTENMISGFYTLKVTNDKGEIAISKLIVK
ncbi:MAG: T9SS type A sorting domain-containing protein [Saprospiraceae bacterium]|nr:T9SS type A sorting domain-containing protein [Saprospiraceae bacterium]